MSEKTIQRASLVGQVIEDLTSEALSQDRFKAQLLGSEKLPQYKPGGFFVFSDLQPGDYTLRISGDHFQPLEYKVIIPEYKVTIPFAPIILGQPGDNELIVITKTVSDNGTNTGKKITFEPVILNKKIRSGASVVAAGIFASPPIANHFSGKLVAALDIGKVMQAKLDRIDGLAEGTIVRIIRDKSIRLKFNPYYRFSFPLTHIVGEVLLKNTHKVRVPLTGIQVRLTKVNGAPVVLNDVSAAKIATFEGVGTGIFASPPMATPVEIILGTEKDVTTFTNHRGDYNLYFRPGQVVGNATLEASFPGYVTQTKTITITENARNRVDFEIFKL